MRRSCAIALAVFAALAIAHKVHSRNTYLLGSVTGSGSRTSDDFAVPLLEAISQERDAGTTGVPLLSLVNVCPRWPFCHDAKVLVYTLHKGRVIFYWYRKDQPCSIEYHTSGPCENVENKGFEILARIIESQKSGLQVKDGRLMWEDKYVYAFSLQGLQIHKFAFTGRIFFQKDPRTRAYFSQAVSVSRNALEASGPERPEATIIPGAEQSATRHAVPAFVWAVVCGFVVVVLATIHLRSRRQVKHDPMHPFICSVLSPVQTPRVLSVDEPTLEKFKAAPFTMRCPERPEYPDDRSNVSLDSPQYYNIEKDEAVPMGSLESTCAPSSAPSSSMSNSVVSRVRWEDLPREDLPRI